MTCNARKRKDDIPKRSKREQSWQCHECGALMFSVTKPKCRKVMLAEMNSRAAFAEVEAIELNLDNKVKP